MNLVFDVLHADRIEVSLPITADTLGLSGWSLDESLRKVFEDIGIEIVKYGSARRFINRQGKAVQICVEG